MLRTAPLSSTANVFSLLSYRYALGEGKRLADRAKDQLIMDSHSDDAAALHSTALALHSDALAADGREILPRPGGLAAHDRGLAAHDRGLAAHDRELAAHDRELAAHDRELAAHDRELAGWLAAAAVGDARAFESFYERSIGFTTGVARRIVGTNHLEDVLSDAYFQAWRDAARFDVARGNAMSWIVTITRSRALDRLRQENVRRAGLSATPEAGFDEAGDEFTPGPDSLLEQLQSASALHRAMATLAVNERWCLALAYYREHSHSEIAALTGLPLGTVKSLINRAQQKLRELLSGGSTAARARS
jgi:RNA polymerase sigma-70 factor, ECF subfamily